jgi:hypothetical protein
MWRSIHPSAQKKNSANFAIIRFSKVATLRSSYFSEVHTILSRLSERGESMDISGEPGATLLWVSWHYPPCVRPTGSYESTQR